MNTENQELPFNMPEGFKLMPYVSSSTEARIYIQIDDVLENYEWYQTRGLTPAEAGELAYALHNAATRAIGMAHEMREAEETGRPGIGLPVEEELEETVFGEEV